jgi:sugar phosphate isomerase/epimerase
MNIIASRPGSYREHRHLAFEYLPKAGIRNVEIPPPEPGEIEGTKAALAEHGLTATSINTRCELSKEDQKRALVRVMDTAREMDVGIVFSSTKTGGLPVETAYQMLRELGDRAAERGVVITMETHPDMCQNGDQMLQTMKAVDHPNIRLNFDPANIYYYNRGVEAVEELKKVAGYVASFHLKDTKGGYKQPEFPVLGKGVVDFPEIFRILNGLGFYGPFTLELEGISGLTLEKTHQRVVDCVEYLRSIGAMET